MSITLDYDTVLSSSFLRLYLILKNQGERKNMGKKKHPILTHACRKSHHGPKNGPSENKYKHLVPPRKDLYNPVDKTFRTLPIKGEPWQVVKAGLRVTFHGRLYELVNDVVIPVTSYLPGVHSGVGLFQLVKEGI